MGRNTDTPTGGLDDTDRHLLDALTTDGRASYTAIANTVGMSVSAVHARVQRLQDAGVITGYTATVDPAAIGLTVSAFVTVTPPRTGAPVPELLHGLDGITRINRIADPLGDGWLIEVQAATLAALNGILAEIRDLTGATTRTAIVLPD